MRLQVEPQAPLASSLEVGVRLMVRELRVQGVALMISWAQLNWARPQWWWSPQVSPRWCPWAPEPLQQPQVEAGISGVALPRHPRYTHLNRGEASLASIQLSAAAPWPHHLHRPAPWRSWCSWGAGQTRAPSLWRPLGRSSRLPELTGSMHPSSSDPLSQSEGSLPWTLPPGGSADSVHVVSLGGMSPLESWRHSIRFESIDPLGHCRGCLGKDLARDTAQPSK